MIGWNNFVVLLLVNLKTGYPPTAAPSNFRLLLFPCEQLLLSFSLFCGHLCVTKFMLWLPYAIAMDPFYFEPTKPIAKTPTAPTGWRYLAELCAIREGCMYYHILHMYAEGPDFAQTKNFVIIEHQTKTMHG